MTAENDKKQAGSDTVRRLKALVAKREKRRAAMLAERYEDIEPETEAARFNRVWETPSAWS